METTINYFFFFIFKNCVSARHCSFIEIQSKTTIINNCFREFFILNSIKVMNKLNANLQIDVIAYVNAVKLIKLVLLMMVIHLNAITRAFGKRFRARIA